MSKSYFSIYADKFKLMRSELSDSEVLDILSAISDLCLWGECEYTPQTPKQQYFWELVTAKFKEDDELYNARSNAGKIGMLKRWGKQDDNKTDNKQNNKTDNKVITKEITKQQTTSNLKTYSSDKSSEYAKKKKISFENVVDWESLFDYWEQNKKGGKYKTAESKNRQLGLLKKLSNDDFEVAKNAITFAIDNNYQGFTDGSRLYYKNVSAAPASRKTADDDAAYWAELERRVAEDDYE